MYFGVCTNFALSASSKVENNQYLKIQVTRTPFQNFDFLKLIIGEDSVYLFSYIYIYLFVMVNCVFVTFPCGILGQVWYLIVSIHDLCCLSYFIQASRCVFSTCIIFVLHIAASLYLLVFFYN